MNCRYCKKPCKNENSLRNHERLCKLNPDHQLVKGGFIKYNELRKELKIKGCNQYTKAKKEGREIKISEETRKKFSSCFMGKKHSEESKRKISESMQKAVRENPDSYSASNINGRTKKILYKDVWLDSKWEYEFAKWCDDNNIIWEKNKKGFEYEWEGKRLYYPDFYLKDFDSYIEVKGYERERDREKWKSVKNLIVIKIKEINQIRKGQYSLSI